MQKEKFKFTLDKSKKHSVNYAQVQSNKPMTQTSKQIEFLPESCRWWDGSRDDFAQWTAEGGLNAARPVSTDGFFPRYQGKTCDGTSPSGRFSSIWVAPQKFQAFVPKEPINRFVCG